jgi:Mlc titration factor MtfA (ptsG expression regulator)
MFHWLTERRRRHLLEGRFPDAWRVILEANVAVYALLDDDERARLRDLVQVFVAEKHWEAAGGLALTDEIRVTVAGTGCQLLLARDHDLFARLVSIVVYPSAIVLPAQPPGVFTVSRAPIGDVPIAGLANRIGTVVLAWDQALGGARGSRDGRNTVIHELAHQIDFLDGDADGTPPLEPAARKRWAEVFSSAFLDQRARAEAGLPSMLRDYAVENEAEYFAVATEMFFEQPQQLAAGLPDIYAALREFYGLDLAARTGAGSP